MASISDKYPADILTPNPCAFTEQTPAVINNKKMSGKETAILYENNLIYKMSQPLSVASNRTYKKQWFQNRNYSDTDQTMICDFNSGNNFIDPFNSFLTFDLKVNGIEGDTQEDYSVIFGSTRDTNALGLGLVTNLFRNVKVTHRSGTLLSRTERTNIWSKIKFNYQMSRDWTNTIGQAMELQEAFVGNVATPAPVQRFAVPLTLLDPFFAPDDGKLIPPQIASGMRVEIELEKKETALLLESNVQNQGVASYQLQNIYFLTNETTMVDSAVAAVSREASETGLEYSYNQIFTSPVTVPSSSTNINSQIRKGVAYALVAYGRMFDEADLTDQLADSLIGLPYLEDSSQSWRLGSQQYPTLPIESSIEGYMNAVQVFDKLKNKPDPCSVNPVDFKGGNSLYSVSLERDTALDLSGSAVNNSRILEAQLTFSTPAAAASQLVLFLSYSTVARATLENCSVKS